MKFTSKTIILTILIASIFAFNCSAVTSKIVKHTTEKDFTATDAETENVIITSQGKISLSQQAKVIIEDINDVWTINTIAADKNGILYLGTSPNGQIFKYENQTLTEIYPLEDAKVIEPNDVNDPNDPNDPNTVLAKPITNKHVFALAFDKKNKLLAGISGETAQLIHFDGKKNRTIFDSNETNYIFDIAIDKDGTAYFATGPQGKIFQLKKSDSKPELIYDAKDKNILCLAIKDNFIFAGSDERGLVYKINIADKTASVLYDAAEKEIVSLTFDNDGNLYALSANEAAASKSSSAPMGMSTPPMPNGPRPGQSSMAADGVKLKTANTPDTSKQKTPPRKVQLQQGKPTGPASHIYKITPQGFVSDVFAKESIFFAMANQNEKLIVASGNQGRLYQFDPETLDDSLLYQDKISSHILAIAQHKDNLYIAMGNPARLAIIEPQLAKSGYYISPLIDAAQPAKWGMFQIEADIPQDTAITLQSRTGNVAEANDTTFSAWTGPIELTSPAQLNLPQGRFCQYKLTLETKNVQQAPVISETTIAWAIPNVAPKVLAITAKPEKPQTPNMLKIEYQAADDNADTLTYKIQTKEINKDKWITLKKDLDKPSFLWNTKTIEDGRYQIKVIADDYKSNDSTTNLTNEKISDPIVIDNTAPDIFINDVKIKNDTVTISVTAVDSLSTIKSLTYVINSDEDFQAALPTDMIYDMIREKFIVTIKDLKPDVYAIAFKATDSVSNIRYKTIEVEIK